MSILVTEVRAIIADDTNAATLQTFAPGNIILPSIVYNDDAHTCWGIAS